MKKTYVRILAAVLAAALAVSLFFIIRQQIDYRKGICSYEQAQQTVGVADLKLEPVTVRPSITEPAPAESEEEPEAEEEEPPREPDANEAALLELDLAALQQTNPDVKGWIAIPDTVISYPITQGADNDYYLNHTWNHEWNSAGSIFLEHLISPDFTDYNTLIYGHRMNNDTMFTGLHGYKSLEFWQTHPYVYILTPTGVSCYQVYAAYEASMDSITYALELKSASIRRKFIDFGLENSWIDTGVQPAVTEPVITLVCCTGHGHAARWVVQAVLDHTIPAEQP